MDSVIVATAPLANLAFDKRQIFLSASDPLNRFWNNEPGEAIGQMHLCLCFGSSGLSRSARFPVQSEHVRD